MALKTNPVRQKCVTMSMLLPLTSPNDDWFVKFFHQETQQINSNEVITRQSSTFSWKYLATFYCAMHYSAKRSLAMVCPCVTLVDQDHIGWKSWKLIARTFSPTSSLFIAQRSSTHSQGNMEKFWGDEVGWEKVACWSTKAAISRKRVNIDEKLLWRAYRESKNFQGIHI